jgi:hypothetical protein
VGNERTEIVPISDEQFRAALLEAAALGWDACVAALVYEDGTPVDVAYVKNPYREEN